MDIKIVGISGSPVKNGNVETFMNNMLSSVSTKNSVQTESFQLSRLNIKDCTHCNFCIKKQKIGKYCSLDDDCQIIFEKVEEADIIVLATPVYFMRTSGLMASFIDRLRVFVFGNIAGGKLKNKVGVSAAVAWARHGGFETTHISHINTFLTLEMIPTSVHNCVSPLGASAVASPNGTGVLDLNTRLGVENDIPGLHSGAAMMTRAIELTTLLKQSS